MWYENLLSALGAITGWEIGRKILSWFENKQWNKNHKEKFIHWSCPFSTCYFTITATMYGDRDPQLVQNELNQLGDIHVKAFHIALKKND